ncbi:hypothetical protein HDA32_006032 [Spinactinospora alkalitolerans]|uniref:Uncharacterized protein n=1 Tax=Spinactinospora alkalitolerans TaxID=687207 RepID=A0A852U5Y5_9ACTN|nr:hypothetical protein [Spinactinospora alkalitolerans]NYE50912.1 hypothetical protein [Spinactinospora alkalitolerans]
MGQLLVAEPTRTEIEFLEIVAGLTMEPITAKVRPTKDDPEPQRELEQEPDEDEEIFDDGVEWP